MSFFSNNRENRGPGPIVGNPLNGMCEKKEIEKKYYDILSCPNPLIEDVKEFVDFLNNHGINSEELVNILYSTIHDNVVNYGLKNNWWERIWKKN